MSEIPHAARFSRFACEVMFSRMNQMINRPASSPVCIAKARKASEGWWSQTGSNRRPRACKARALPAELWPRDQKQLLARSLFRLCRVVSHVGLPASLARQPSLPTGSPSRSPQRERRLVGLGRLELPTSRLSSARSNQLSYKPLTHGAFMRARDRNDARCNRTSAAPGACSSAKKEKRRRRNPAYGAHLSRSMISRPTDGPGCF